MNRASCNADALVIVSPRRRAAADALGGIRHANDNPAGEFSACSKGCFERWHKLMNDPDFAGHVAAVRKGKDRNFQ